MTNTHSAQEVASPREVVASNVAAFRGMRGLSQPEVAQRMAALGHDWTPSTVSRSESGDRGIEVSELLALALVLGVNPGELVDPTGPAGDLERGLDVGVGGLRHPTAASGWARGLMRIRLLSPAPSDLAITRTPWTETKTFEALVAAMQERGPTEGDPS